MIEELEQGAVGRYHGRDAEAFAEGHRVRTEFNLGASVLAALHVVAVAASRPAAMARLNGMDWLFDVELAKVGIVSTLGQRGNAAIPAGRPS